MVASKDGLRFSYSDQDRLEDIGVNDGIVFHLYAIEDEGSDWLAGQLPSPFVNLVQGGEAWLNV